LGSEVEDDLRAGGLEAVVQDRSVGDVHLVQDGAGCEGVPEILALPSAEIVDHRHIVAGPEKGIDQV
jgi:hypothetical protein